MKKIILLCSLTIALNLAAAYCQQLSKIELSDGSTINGEVVSLANGAYTIKTPTVGEIKVAQEKVVKIESASHALTYEPAQSGDLMQSQVAAMRQKLMASPENAAIVTGVAKNPQLQEMANDPEILDAAKKGDIQALMKNPKFMEIVNSPEMQEAVKKIKK